MRDVRLRCSCRSLVSLLPDKPEVHEWRTGEAVAAREAPQLPEGFGLAAGVVILPTIGYDVLRLLDYRQA